MSLDRRFGSGWISGVLSTTLGAMGFGGVLCLLFPSLLTSPLFHVGGLHSIVCSQMTIGAKLVFNRGRERTKTNELRVVHSKEREVC
jgi:hypothetical protein